ncbi:MAG: tetratricopeptide repeat protein [Candidatus Levyibacteriota bacterium]
MSILLQYGRIALPKLFMMQKNFHSGFSKVIASITPVKAILAIISLGYLVFGNAMNNQFVWDDKTFILENPEVHSVNITKLFGQNMFNNGSYYRPIPATYFAILYSLFNTAPFFYHFFQISFHITVVVLLFLLFKRFFPLLLALFLALVFLVHPINTESVVYVGASISVLFTLFGLPAFLLSMKETLNSKRLIAVYLLLLCALLTKETAVLYVGAILLYRYLFHKPLLRFFGTSIAIVLTYLPVRFFIGGVFFQRVNAIPIMKLSLIERLYTIPQVISYYISTAFYPDKLSIAQNWVVRSASLHEFYIPLCIDLLFFIIVAAVGILMKKDRKACTRYTFFFCWFASGLFLHSQVVPLDMTVADRWFYFPLIGLLGMIGVVVQKFFLPYVRSRVALVTIAVFIITILSLRTVIRNTNWSNPITLYSHDLKVREDYDKHNSLGAELWLVGKHDEAIAHFKRSIELFPEDLNYTNLGLAYEQLGNIKEAKILFGKALSSDPYIIDGIQHRDYTYLAMLQILLNEGSYNDALKLLKKAQSDYPSYIRFWFYLAYAEYKLGNRNEAIYAAAQTYRLDPNPTTAGVYNRIVSNQPLTISLH